MRAELALFLALGLQQVPPTESGGQQQAAGLWDRILALYEQAKQAGEEVPGNAYDWIKQDLENVGDWEYTIVSVPAVQPATLQRKMNELGDERWECFEVTFDGESYHLFFRRRTRSYVSSIPVGELLRLLPSSTGQDGGE